jgi:tetratricopeptide (TPR) repeat protein
VAAHRKATNIRAMLSEDFPDVEQYKVDIATSCRDIGDALRATGQVEEGLGFYQTAIEIDESLLTEHPNSGLFQMNLAKDLAPYGEALALLGQWSESAEVYAKAVIASRQSFPLAWPAALVQLAAGNETGYRDACGDLARRFGSNARGEALFALVFTLVAGPKSLEDPQQVLALARRAHDEDPADAATTVLLGAAEFRAGRAAAASELLTKGLAALDAPASDKSRQAAVGTLGRLLLTEAYREQGNAEGLKTAREQLRVAIEQNASLDARTNANLPLWLVGFTIEMAKRALDSREKPAADDAAAPPD